MNENFLLSEYQSLRRQIEIYIEAMNRTEEYALLASASGFAWLVTVSAKVDDIVWLALTVIPCLGALRVYAIYRHFLIIGKYLRIVEREFEQVPAPVSNQLLGWESHLSKSDSSFTRAHVFFWTLYFLISCVVVMVKLKTFVC